MQRMFRISSARRSLRSFKLHFPTPSCPRISSPCVLAQFRIFSAGTAALYPVQAAMSSSPSVEYNCISGVEALEEYTPGGYHPVMIGDTLRDRYQVVHKLGHGGYSTIWLAHDHCRRSFVALKIGLSDPSLTQKDVQVLEKLSHEAIPRILDYFDVTGPNGMHPCYTMPLAQGSLEDALSSPMFSIPVARVLSAKLALAVHYIHSQGLVHGDLHLQNMLVKNNLHLDDMSVAQFWERIHRPREIPITRVDGKPLMSNVPRCAVRPLSFSNAAREYTVEDARRFLLADFGESFFPSTEERRGRDSHTPLAGRAPEAFFEPDTPMSFPSDIWTMGTAIWEILGMKFIFSQHEPKDVLVAEHIDVLGYEGFPEHWRRAWERPAGTEEMKNLPRKPTRSPLDEWPPLENAWEAFNQKFRRQRKTGIFDEEESRAILDLMRGMLRFGPGERLTAAEVLESEWMVKWALPEQRGESV